MDQKWSGALCASTAEISDTYIFYGMMIILELLNEIPTIPEIYVTFYNLRRHTPDY